MPPESSSFLPSSFDDVARNYLLNDLLRGVSRSFYLTLRVLPQPLREPISVAYLLARAADTLADTTVVPMTKRAAALQQFHAQLQLDKASEAALERLREAYIDRLDHIAESELLTKLPALFELFARQTSPDRALIRNVVLTLIEGMLSDLENFPIPVNDAMTVTALADEQQLARYTYLVAGCVGEFWTKISIAHTDELQAWGEAEAQYSNLGIRFGQALQMTNILRDVPRDLRLGRCYLPQPWLDEVGLTAAALLNANNSATAQPLLIKGIDVALAHYASAEAYVTALPRRCLRLRLAALWPLLIGLKTLAQLSQQKEWLEVAHVCKVKRGWVYRMMLLSCGAVFANSLLRWWCAQLRRGIARPS